MGEWVIREITSWFLQLQSCNERQFVISEFDGEVGGKYVWNFTFWCRLLYHEILLKYYTPTPYYSRSERWVNLLESATKYFELKIHLLVSQNPSILIYHFSHKIIWELLAPPSLKGNLLEYNIKQSSYHELFEILKFTNICLLSWEDGESADQVIVHFPFCPFLCGACFTIYLFPISWILTSPFICRMTG